MKAQAVYKQIPTSKEIIMEKSGSFVNPVATLSDGFGVCQIIRDDNCYVVCLRQRDGRYKPTVHIFKEAFEVLKMLPPLED